MIEFDDDQAAAWREVLLLLAIARWHPLWADLGLPAELAASPAGATAATVRAWETWLVIRQVPAQSRGDLRRVTGAMVGEVAAELATAYGEPATAALFDWARRHFVDLGLRSGGLAWIAVLRRLAGIAGRGYPLVELHLPTPVCGTIGALTARHLTLDEQDRDAARLAATGAALPTDFEVMMAVADPALLERVRDGLDQVLVRERAWRALAAILDGLAPDARDVFRSWAGRQASAMEIPPDMLVVPGPPATAASPAPR